MAAHKFLKIDSSGRTAEETSVATSAGAGDDGKLVALTTAGVLDSTIVNSVQASAGAGDAAKVVALDSAGRIDSTMMPVGVGADTATIVASEALSAGDFVNVWDDAGTIKVRKADATTAGKEADGFVLAAVSSAANATVYFEGQNNQRTGLTLGARYYLSTTPGGAATTVLTSAGNVVQYLGRAVSTTTIVFEGDEGMIRA